MKSQNISYLKITKATSTAWSLVVIDSRVRHSTYCRFIVAIWNISDKVSSNQLKRKLTKILS